MNYSEDTVEGVLENCCVGQDMYWIESVGDVDIVGRWGSPGNTGSRPTGTRRHRAIRHGYWPRYGGGEEYIEVPLVSYAMPNGEIKPLKDDDTTEVVAGLFDSGFDSVEGFWDVIAAPFKAVAKVAKKVGGDIVHTANSVVKFAGKSIIAPIGKGLTSIPFVGPVISAAAKITPFYALGNIAARVLKGERLDKAFLSTAKDSLKGAKDLAPYIAQVASFVPGVGTGVAAALAAGTALAEGKSVSDALLKGIKGALPGGAAAGAIFDGGLALIHGQNLTTAAINAAKSQLPKDVGLAIDAAVKIAKGKNVKEAVLQAVSAKLQGTAKDAFQKALALGAARNIQSNVTKKVTTAPGMKAVAAIGQKVLAAKNVPQSIAKPVLGLNQSQAAGYKTALGLMMAKGVTPHMVVATRAALGPIQQTGFDHGLKTYMNHFTNETFSSLVKNGIVSRGNWRPVSRTAAGAVYGRVIKDGKVTPGYFSRA